MNIASLVHRVVGASRRGHKVSQPAALPLANLRRLRRHRRAHFNERSGGRWWISRHRRPLNQQPPLWEGVSLPKATTRSGQRSGARPTTLMPHPYGQPVGQPPITNSSTNHNGHISTGSVNKKSCEKWTSIFHSPWARLFYFIFQPDFFSMVTTGTMMTAETMASGTPFTPTMPRIVAPTASTEIPLAAA